MLERLRLQAPTWRRALRRRRRLLAVLTAVVLLATILPGLLPPDRRGVPVLVASGDLAQGATLTATDLRLEHVAPSLVPDGALTQVEDAEGSTLAVPVAAGTVVLPSTLLGEQDMVDLDGRVTMILPVEPGLVPYLTRGTRLGLELSGPDPLDARTVRADVLEVADGTNPSAIGTTGPQTVPVVVAMSPEDARHVARSTRDGWAMVTILH